MKYTVIAEDGSTKSSYDVIITKTSNDTKSITDFALFVGKHAVNGQQGEINENERKITLGLPAGTSLTNITPAITHTGVSVSPEGPQNFTNPVTYTVTAANGTTKQYTVEIIAGYTVKFNSNGGSAVSRVYVTPGAKVARPQEPTRNGYIFDGWYTDYKMDIYLMVGIRITI